MDQKAICEKFNSHDFHDSKLISFKLLRNESRGEIISEDIIFEIDLLKFESWSRQSYSKTELVLKDCMIVRMDLDLAGKRCCSDDISSTRCYTIDSPLKGKLIQEFFEHEKDALDDYLHFSITMIPPGGDIDIFAKDFELVHK